MVIGVELVIGLYRNDVGAEIPRIPHQRAGLDTERLGGVAGGDRDGGIRQRLDDDDGLAAQRRVFLLFARREEGVEIEEQPLDRIIRRRYVHRLFLYPMARNMASLNLETDRT